MRSAASKFITGSNGSLPVSLGAARVIVRYPRVALRRIAFIVLAQRMGLTRLSRNINQPSFEKVDQFLRGSDPRVRDGLTIGSFHEHCKSMSI
jgi:hypothetical protein